MMRIKVLGSPPDGEGQSHRHSDNQGLKYALLLLRLKAGAFLLF